jgi:polar amino acid transport system substrate-binding protein
MKIKIIGVMFLITWISPVFAAQPLLFNTTTTGFPPFFVKSQELESGIMYDVMQYISQKHGVKIETVGLPKKRIRKQLDAGLLDANASAKEWTEDSHRYIYTDVVIEVRDVLFSLQENPINFNTAEDLIGKTISTHHGYHYPKLQPYFTDGRINTIAERNELTMLKSVLFRRADAAVINESVANWIIKNEPTLQNRFVASKLEVDSFDYRIMFTKKWQKFVDVFNRELALMKKNGELKKIFDKYAQ